MERDDGLAIVKALIFSLTFYIVVRVVHLVCPAAFVLDEAEVKYSYSLWLRREVLFILTFGSGFCI